MVRVPYVPKDTPGPIADAIRARRGTRGLTPLDRSLLNAPPVAEGWSKLLGAIRTGSTLQDDLREIMILRVAARNRAAFEWIHHEHVATSAGVTREQLTRIGDVQAPTASLTSAGPGQLSELQAAALRLADAMTTTVQVPETTFSELRAALAQGGDSEGEATNRKMTEAVATCATYNMVSRFLVALDIDERADQPCPVPGLAEEEATPRAAAYPHSADGASNRGLVQAGQGVNLSTRVHFHSMQAPWLVLVNSLMTNLTMWDQVVPALSGHFNLVTYDQRGHGNSSVPPQPCTVDALADDVAAVLDGLGIDKAHAVVGVSQGGATALAFAVRHSHRAARIVACDTQAASPEANRAAWDERIALAHAKGMEALAEATVPRWYGPGSAATDEVRRRTHAMIMSTSVEGFEKGARALQGYDLLAQGLVDQLKKMPTLLVAGSADGKLPETLKKLSTDAGTTFAEIPNAGHLPMCDQPKAWLDAVLPWLLSK
ncbi:alpha/beta-hydrolase [Acaromyces ingoldii]|uniref:Alpha/beta-hydrolase n=1 Tax=Acaromyces ingoldii TaxID=215250 RepID=A0A316YMH7_9BASI|nr:alpha/beta-hydrolase [Acaromyces ingoldii]PWN88945.1 alpha/beta-hydrolase [Acaromyces ingoldii]